MGKLITVEFNKNGFQNIALELLECIATESLEEPNAFRTQAARMIAGNAQDILIQEFVRVMENPRPMLQKMRDEGVKECDERAPFISLLLTAAKMRGYT